MISYPSVADFADDPHPFPAADVLSGLAPSPGADDGAGYVRVVVDDRADLLKFFGGAPEGCTKGPVIFLRGDVLRGPPEAPRIIQRYRHIGSREQQRWALETATAFGRPFLHLARPGICGSSGDHRQRRQEREVALVDHALDRLKEAFGWRRLNLVGQSGGGHLVGALMARRSDIDCAVMASSNLAVQLRNELAGRLTDITGYMDFVDPIKQVHQVAANPPKKVIVLTDKKDATVLCEVQCAYVTALRAAGVDVDHRFLEAVDDAHHSLWFAGLVAAFTYLDRTEPA